MKYCMECGEKLEDDQLFCPMCGAKVQQTPEEQPELLQDQMPIQPEIDNKTKKSNKLGIILGICSGVLAIGVVILVLFLTGVFGKNSLRSQKTMEPSKDKLIQLEEKALADAQDQIAAYVTELGKTSFDADVTVELPEMESSDGFDTAAIIKNAKIQIRSDVQNGKNVGFALLLYNNPLLDVRVFDLDQKTISFYCAPGSDKLYVASLDVLMKNLTQSEDVGNEKIDAVMDFAFSEDAKKKIESDYEALKKAFTDTIDKAEIDIKTEQTVALFNGQEQVTCELYTWRPTQEQIEFFLNNILDVFENGDGYFAKVFALSGMTESDFQKSRENISETAKTIYEEELTFIVAIQGNDIIRQEIKTDEFDLIYDTLKKDTGSKKMISFLEDDQEMAVFSFVEGLDGKCDIELNFESSFKLVGSFDKNKKSVIGTFAGSFDVIVDSEKVATIAVEPNENGMMHTISIGADVLDLDAEGDMKIRINVTPGTGVQRPSGAETVDISNYTPEQLEELLYKLISPLMMLGSLR